MDAGTIMVGAGHAAGECALKLRQLAYAAPITMIGAEAHPPYQRPPLSKAFLSGDIDEAALHLRPSEVYAKQRINLVSGTSVVAIERARHSIVLSDGRSLPYGKLVLATGGRARPLACPGAGLDGVLTLRTLDDVILLRRYLDPGSRLVIVGGGYVGLEVASVLIGQGVAVTLIEAASRLLARVSGTDIAAFYQRVHGDAGVDIHTNATLRRIVPSEDDSTRIGCVELADGRRFPADLLLAGIGLLPNVELAERSGLQVENGITVDEYCCTEDPDILAIGDCAIYPNSFLGRRVRLESVPNVLEQARVAASRICGRPASYGAMPWFWSDQYDLKLQSVGVSDGHDEVVVRGAPQSRSFVVFYLREGAVIAADAVNRPGDFMVARRLVGARLGSASMRIGDQQIGLKTFSAAGGLSVRLAAFHQMRVGSKRRRQS